MSRAEVVSKSNRPSENGLGEDRYIYHDIVKNSMNNSENPYLVSYCQSQQPPPNKEGVPRGTPAGNGCGSVPLKARGTGNNENSQQKYQKRVTILAYRYFLNT